jgi:hypothetical protein
MAAVSIVLPGMRVTVIYETLLSQKISATIVMTKFDTELGTHISIFVSNVGTHTVYTRYNGIRSSQSGCIAILLNIKLARFTRRINRFQNVRSYFTPLHSDKCPTLWHYHRVVCSEREPFNVTT